MLMEQIMTTEAKIPLMEKEEKSENIIKIESRYGEISADLEKAVYFPKGLLGLPQFKDFCIVNMPNPKLAQFKLLQSLNDSQLSFVVLPLAADNQFIEIDDIKECCKVTGVTEEDLLMLLIITVQRTPDGESKITANVRAPVVVDAARQAAVQYVFPNNKYEIQHRLS